LGTLSVTRIRPYRFGPIDVDPAAGEIYKSGIKVRVPKELFQILLTLLERPGEVL
jgi:DNA-binding winged helix-turn-helix (wHTH) protein